MIFSFAQSQLITACSSFVFPCFLGFFFKLYFMMQVTFSWKLIFNSKYKNLSIAQIHPGCLTIFSQFSLYLQIIEFQFGLAVCTSVGKRVLTVFSSFQWLSCLEKKKKICSISRPSNRELLKEIFEKSSKVFSVLYEGKIISWNTPCQPGCFSCPLKWFLESWLSWLTSKYRWRSLICSRRRKKPKKLMRIGKHTLQTYIPPFLWHLCWIDFRTVENEY